MQSYAQNCIFLLKGFPILFSLLIKSICFFKVAILNYTLCSKCIYSYFGLSRVVFIDNPENLMSRGSNSEIHPMLKIYIPVIGFLYYF